MKKILLIFSLYLIAGLAMAQSGQNEASKIPFYDVKKVADAHLLKNHGIIDTIWVPVSASGIYPNGKDFHWFYDYYDDGWIKTWTDIFSTSKTVRSYIKHYPFPFARDYGWTEADTTTFYKKKAEETEYTPTNRYYYDYGDYPACLTEYTQTWSAGAWETVKKRVTCYMDTLGVSRLPYLSETFEGGRQTHGLWITLLFDKEGNVTEQCAKRYNTATQDYKEWAKIEYFYDASVLKSIMHSEYYDGAYHQDAKTINIEWLEYSGFGDGTFFNWKDLNWNNKATSKESWLVLPVCSREEPDWELFLIEKIDWDIKGKEVAIRDSFYIYNAVLDTLYFSDLWCYHRDDHGNNCINKSISYHSPSYSNTFGDTLLYTLDSTVNYYDHRDRFYRYDEYTEHYRDIPGSSTNTNGIEYAYTYTEVDSFRWYLPLAIDEKLPASPPMLKILPNPSGDGTVQIIADKEMRRISVYTLEGKMVYDSPVSGKEALISTAPLSQGIYIVQALLKNGNKQTGKLVIK